MDLAFWLGILLGFISSFIFWYITTKVLTPHIAVSETLERLLGPDGGRRYRFSLKNSGHRDAVDVRVKCNLFSIGWASGSSDEVSIIEIPVSVDQIDVIPGKRFGFLPATDRPLDMVGDRLISLDLPAISGFQKRKLEPRDKARLENGELGVEDLLDLGAKSVINIVVYGFDRFSGSRSVYSERYYKRADIREEASRPHADRPRT